MKSGLFPRFIQVDLIILKTEKYEKHEERNDHVSLQINCS